LVVESLFSGDQILFLNFNPSEGFGPELCDCLFFSLRQNILAKRLDVELKVKHKSGHDWRDVVELVVFVFKVFVVERGLTDDLVFPLRQELFSALPFVHHSSNI